MKITSVDKSVGDFLRMGYFEIPRFQRPYSWERSEVEDFWQDTVAEAESDYFIGSVVLFNSAKGCYGVVDGQQRLTTITMLLCALRDRLAVEGFREEAAGLHLLIERPDINNKKRYVLRSETSYPYLQLHIQQFDEPQKEVCDVGDEEKRLQAAHELLADQLGKTVTSIRANPSWDTKKKEQQVLNELLRIRDVTLGLNLIVVTLDNEDDAYTIFETLNTRGRDLKVSDLVRTQITRLLPQANQGVDRPKERFNGIVELFEASEEDISINSFLHHYWLSKRDYTTEKKLYKAFKKQVRTEEQASEFIEELEFDSRAYRILHEPDYGSWRIEEAGMRDSLHALNLFKVRQQLPFSLAVVREYHKKSLSLALAKRSLAALENFHFAFTAITSQRSSGGISLMYASHARQLRAASSQAKRKQVIDELVAKLRQKLPPFEEFQANFRLLLCSERFTKRKAIVQYILNRFATKLGGVVPDPKRMTIEHLIPQSDKGSGLSPEQIAEIGNLVWVNEDLNGTLGKKPVAEKLKLLQSSGVWLDDFLKAQSKWDAAAIRQRTDHLATLAYEKVWSV